MAWDGIAMLAMSFLGLALVIWANVLYFAIILEVNAAIPIDQRISPWKVGLRSSNFFKRNRELFPKSNKRFMTTWLSGFGLLFILGAVAIGFFVTKVVS